MPWVLQDIRIGTSQIGSVDDRETTKLGTVMQAYNALLDEYAEYIYLQGCSGTTAGDTVTYDAGTFATELASVDYIGPYAIASAAIDTTDKYGWYRVAGTSGLASIVGPEAVYETFAKAQAARILPNVGYVQILGYYEPYDGGGAGYAAVESEPSHDGKFQSLDGRWWELLALFPDPRMFGAKCDFREVTDAAITASSATLTSASLNATSADVGRCVLVTGAGADSAGLRTTIASVTNSTTVVLSDVAGTTVSGAHLSIATDDALAFKRCSKYAETYGRYTHLSAGTYYIGRAEDYLDPGDVELIVSTIGKTGIVGQGIDVTRIFWDDTKVGGAFGAMEFYGGKGTTVGDKLNDVLWRDFTFQGTFDVHGNSTNGADDIVSNFPNTIKAVNNVHVENVRFKEMRGVCLSPRALGKFTAINCEIDHCARGGFVTQTTSEIIIDGLRVYGCDDDFLQFGTQPFGSETDTPITRGEPITVSNVYAWGSGPIKIAGARKVAITNYTSRFALRSALRIQNLDTGYTEAAASNITLTNILVIDPLDSEVMGHPDFGDANKAIFINGTGVAGTEAAIPGDNDPATGEIIDILDWMNINSDDPTTIPVPPAKWLTISNFHVVRTIKPTANFSDYGQGTLSHRGARTWDPEVTEGALSSMIGVAFTGTRVTDVKLSDGIISGMGSGLAFIPASPAVDDELIFSGIEISGVYVEDTYGTGVTFASNIRAGNLDVEFRSCRFNLDPKHTRRNALGRTDGTWAAITDQVAFGDTATGSSVERGLRVFDSLFENLSSPFPVPFDTTTAVHCHRGNTLRMGIAARGFSTSNGGVGYGPAPSEAGWRVQHIQADPNATSYGVTLNDCPFVASAHPTSGTFLGGHYVRNSSPSVTAGFWLMGWFRPGTDTGSAHVTGTNWIEDLDPAWQGGTFTLPDDTSISIPATATFGSVHIACNIQNCHGEVTWISTGVVRSETATMTAFNAEAGDTVLAGTTGNDGTLNFSQRPTDDVMWIENRTGATRTLIIRPLAY